jgi:dolichyl-phosphate-mannose-protein mannosyltransferase
LIAIAVYFATFIPTFFYASDPKSPATLLSLQREMYEAQTQILRDHPYQSDWWSWPLMLRPIWYYYEPDAGVLRGVLLIGNPAVMWGGLIGVLLCLWGAARGRPGYAAVAGLWLFSIAIWAAIPKSLGFYYYYHLSGIFAAMACAAGLSLVKWRYATPAFTALALALFIYFYPILSGAPLADPQDFNRWMWMDSWR